MTGFLNHQDSIHPFQLPVTAMKRFRLKHLSVRDLDLLLRGTIVHGGGLGVLLGTLELLLAELRFLLLLGQIAESAAAGEEDVSDTIALEVVFSANVGALHGLGDPVETDAGRGEEEEARGVDGLIALHVAILAVPVVGLAKGDAWAAVGHHAEVNGAAASKDGIPKVLGLGAGFAVDDLAGIAENVVEPVLPVLDIVVVDGASLGGSLIDGSSHYI